MPRKQPANLALAFSPWNPIVIAQVHLHTPRQACPIRHQLAFLSKLICPGRCSECGFKGPQRLVGNLGCNRSTNPCKLIEIWQSAGICHVKPNLLDLLTSTYRPSIFGVHVSFRGCTSMMPPKPLDVMDLARPTCHEQKTNTQNHWVFLYAFLHLPFFHDPCKCSTPYVATLHSPRFMAGICPPCSVWQWKGMTNIYPLIGWGGARAAECNGATAYGLHSEFNCCWDNSFAK